MKHYSFLILIFIVFHSYSVKSQQEIEYSSFSHPINCILNKSENLDLDKYFVTYEIREISKDVLVETLDYFENNDLKKEILGYELGYVFKEDFKLSPLNQLAFSQNEKGEKANYHFDILSPLIINETTICILYNELIKIGERSGGSTSIAVFKLVDSSWKKVIDYNYGEI